MNQINELLAEVLALRVDLREIGGRVQMLDGLTLALIEENDNLMKEVAYKDNCILALNATVKELQKAVRGT